MFIRASGDKIINIDYVKSFYVKQRNDGEDWCIMARMIEDGSCEVFRGTREQCLENLTNLRIYGKLKEVSACM